MRLCEHHWGLACDALPGGRLLLFKEFVMLGLIYRVDPATYHGWPQELQQQVNRDCEGCPICFLGDGNDLYQSALDKAIEAAV